jgi:RND family efflux transporter MFP subunit
VTVTQVTRGTAAEIVYATGAVEPLQWAKVTTLVKGRIIERCRCEGRFVKAGFVLARLDDAEAQAALREMRAREEFARKEVERQTQLVARGATSAQSFERAETELRQIQALIAAQIERLAYYRIHAPIDGVVLREEGEIGEIVDSSVVLYRIGIPTALQLVAEVNEEDIPRVQLGQSVLIRSDAFPGDRLVGTVREITPAGDPIAKTYRIRVALPDDTPLRVGMSVEANVIARQKQDVLLVPSASLIGNAVFVAKDGRAVRRQVEVGVRGTQMVEILAGLEQGERVISPPLADLRDGARIYIAGESVPVKK